jgi:hypothetical protein
MTTSLSSSELISERASDGTEDFGIFSSRTRFSERMRSPVVPAEMRFAAMATVTGSSILARARASAVSA